MADRPDAFQGAKDPSAGYQLDKFYTRATNDFDHSVTVRVAMPAAMKAKIAQYVRMGVIREYRTDQDVVRDAVHHRLMWLADHIGDFESGEMLSMQAALAQTSQARTHIQERDDFFDQLEKLFIEMERSQMFTFMATTIERYEMQDWDLDEEERGDFDQLLSKWKRVCEQGLMRRGAEA